MNDKPSVNITIDRTFMKRLALWSAIVIGALLLLWPVSLTMLGTTVIGDPAVVIVVRTSELLQKVESLRDNPFGGLASGPIQSVLFWAWVRVLLGATLVLGAIIAMLRGRSARRASRSQSTPDSPS
ncbi:hypothetical protein [Nonomuraea sp. 10N515B]|uniref:hypothetical protein n=1 Tax=Nonomuraea sp. 10N515B TaxID=3457422 RepID=UPI003FCD6FCE